MHSGLLLIQASYILALMFLNVFILSILAQATPSIPEDARQALASLPGNKVSLSVVLNKSIQSSDSYKILKAQKASISLPNLEASAAFDLMTSLSVGSIDDSLEQANINAVSNLESDEYSLELNKYLASGTALSLDLKHSNQAFRVVSTNIPRYYETRAELGFSQNLLKDFFGYASRRRIQAGILDVKANEQNFNKELQVWSKNVSALFYNTWLAQAQVKTALKSKKLRQRLVNISKRKLSRGTTERPDFLQIEASYLTSISQFEEARIQLQDAWQKMIVLAKLPLEWMKIDALMVPMSLDDPSQFAQLLCESNEDIINYKLEELKAKASAAKLKLAAAKNNELPDLKFNARYITNAIDNKAQKSIADINDLHTDQWYLGMSLSYPIGNKQAKADKMKALLNKRVTEAQYVDAQANLAVDRLALCNDFRLQVNNRDRASRIVKKQEERARLEERRFSIGKSNVLQMIQAGDDFSQAEFNLNQAEALLRISAWEVIALVSQTENYMQGLGVKIQ